MKLYESGAKKREDAMRLRLFVLIAVCIILDVLVARQVKQYDAQTSKATQSAEHKQITIASKKSMQSRQRITTQEDKHRAASC